MQGNWDRSIKASLEGHEAPFNPQHWEALEARLDARQRISGVVARQRQILIAACAMTAMLTLSIAGLMFFEDKPFTGLGLVQENRPSAQTAGTDKPGRNPEPDHLSAANALPFMDSVGQEKASATSSAQTKSSNGTRANAGINNLRGSSSDHVARKENIMKGGADALGHLGSSSHDLKTRRKSLTKDGSEAPRRVQDQNHTANNTATAGVRESPSSTNGVQRMADEGSTAANMEGGSAELAYVPLAKIGEINGAGTVEPLKPQQLAEGVIPGREDHREAAKPGRWSLGLATGFETPLRGGIDFTPVEAGNHLRLSAFRAVHSRVALSFGLQYANRHYIAPFYQEVLSDRKYRRLEEVPADHVEYRLYQLALGAEYAFWNQGVAKMSVGGRYLLGRSTARFRYPEWYGSVGAQDFEQLSPQSRTQLADLHMNRGRVRRAEEEGTAISHNFALQLQENVRLLPRLRFILGGYVQLPLSGGHVIGKMEPSLGWSSGIRFYLD